MAAAASMLHGPCTQPVLLGAQVQAQACSPPPTGPPCWSTCSSSGMTFRATAWAAWAAVTVGALAPATHSNGAYSQRMPAGAVATARQHLAPAGVIAIDLIKSLLAAKPNATALFVPAEITSYCYVSCRATSVPALSRPACIQCTPRPTASCHHAQPLCELMVLHPPWLARAAVPRREGGQDDQ